MKHLTPLIPINTVEWEISMTENIYKFHDLLTIHKCFYHLMHIFMAPL